MKQRRRRIQPCARHPGDGIGAARPGGHHAYAEVIGRLCVPFGADRAGLFVRIADGLDRGLRAK